MKKLLSLVVLGAVVLAACGGGSDAVAATVDGQDVTVGQVESMIESDGATIPKEQFAQFLGFQIQWQVINDAAEADYGITVTDEEVAAEADRIVEGAVTEGQSREELLAQQGVTEDFLSMIARQGVIDAHLREILREDAPEPTEEDLESQLNAAKAPLTNACVSHILVATEEEANDVLDRLEGGEEFGELATELSSDTGSAENNGVLPCGTLETYVEPFRDAALIAPVGEIYETPVESQFGWHVVMVTDRDDAAEADLPSDDELADLARDESIQSELQTWFLEAVEGAEVTVDETYGTWQANPPQVVPPASE
ncbi:MAG TPA: peptidylprolyl isomerase [Acidimicrobiia bacterium]|nr:peptidylprolyl isomerase [Acidimicrobiia bacterium]